MEGFYKVVPNNGGTYITAVFFNPTTKEIRDKCVRDYDYSDCSRDNDELYYMPVNQEVRRQYLRFIGYIQEGDLIRVFKGRKVPIGTIARVERRYPIYDRYRRHVADYVQLDNGMTTNVLNCEYAEAD